MRLRNPVRRASAGAFGGVTKDRDGDGGIGRSVQNYLKGFRATGAAVKPQPANTVAPPQMEIA